MKKRMLFLFGILIFIAISCSIPSTEIQPTKISQSATPEVVSQEITTQVGVCENDVFSFTIPEKWGLTDSQGDHYDLNVRKIVTIHNESQSK